MVKSITNLKSGAGGNHNCLRDNTEWKNGERMELKVRGRGQPPLREWDNTYTEWKNRMNLEWVKGREQPLLLERMGDTHKKRTREYEVSLPHRTPCCGADCHPKGLSHSGDHYDEAVDCLKSHYDAPPLKDGSSKELRRLHDTIKQHLHALESSQHNLPGTFITSIIELKLDVDTMFKWQKHTQTMTDVPPYKDLLDFIDLRAQASETSLQIRKLSRMNPLGDLQVPAELLLPSQPTPNPPTFSVLFVQMRSTLCMLVLSSSRCHMKAKSQFWRKIICAWIASTLVILSNNANLSTNVENAKKPIIPCYNTRERANTTARICSTSMVKSGCWSLWSPGTYPSGSVRLLQQLYWGVEHNQSQHSMYQ